MKTMRKKITKYFKKVQNPGKRALWEYQTLHKKSKSSKWNCSYLCQKLAPVYFKNRCNIPPTLMIHLCLTQPVTKISLVFGAPHLYRTKTKMKRKSHDWLIRLFDYISRNGSIPQITMTSNGNWNRCSLEIDRIVVFRVGMKTRNTFARFSLSKSKIKIYTDIVCNRTHCHWENGFDYINTIWNNEALMEVVYRTLITLLHTSHIFFHQHFLIDNERHKSGEIFALCLNSMNGRTERHAKNKCE